MENNLPKPEETLPKPELEIPAHTGVKMPVYKTKVFFVFVALSFLIAFLIGGFILGSNYSSKNETVPESVTTTASPTSTPDPTADWNSYVSNLEKDLSFEYPANWTVTKNSSDKTTEEFEIKSPNGFKLLFNTSPKNPDGGCDNCKVTYVEKVNVPGYKTLTIAEGTGATGNVIYLSDTDLEVGDNLVDWEVSSRNNPAKYKYIFLGRTYDNSENVTYISADKFSNNPDTQTVLQILRSIKYN